MKLIVTGPSAGALLDGQAGDADAGGAQRKNDSPDDLHPATIPSIQLTATAESDDVHGFSVTFLVATRTAPVGGMTFTETVRWSSPSCASFRFPGAVEGDREAVEAFLQACLDELADQERVALAPEELRLQRGATRGDADGADDGLAVLGGRQREVRGRPGAATRSGAGARPRPATGRAATGRTASGRATATTTAAGGRRGGPVGDRHRGRSPARERGRGPAGSGAEAARAAAARAPDELGTDQAATGTAAVKPAATATAGVYTAIASLAERP